MQTFTHTDYTIVCQSVNTRSGFKHVAHLLHHGRELCETKCCYQNRTWEAYTFQTVISKLLALAEKEECMSIDNAKEFKEYCEKNHGSGW